MRAKERWRESQRNRQLWEENEALNLPRQRSEAAGASKRALERAGCRIRRIWALTLYHLSARAPLECSLPIALPWIICAASSSSLPLITNSVLNCNLNQVHLKPFRQNCSSYLVPHGPRSIGSSPTAVAGFGALRVIIHPPPSVCDIHV